MESHAMRLMRQSRADLLATHPFFGILALKLELIENPNIPTVRVNTRELQFNPQFVESLTNAERKAIWAHEVMHLALGHHARQGFRNADRWNQAGDHAINHELTAEGFHLPKGALMESRFKDMSAESIYRILEDETPESQDNNSQEGKPQEGQGEPANGKATPGAGCPTGDFESAGPEDSAEASAAEQEWKQNAAEALRAASAAGQLPEGLRRTISEGLAPKADWESLLRRFATDQVKTRTTWSKRNKRFPDIFLPGRVNAGMGSIVLGVDTSGSVTPELLNRFAAEITGIAADLEPAAIHVIYCDARVNRIETFEPGEDIKLEPCGGGGTDFRPVFEHIDSHDLNPACVVYLTDLAGRFPDQECPFPTLWAAYDARGAVAPWGETVVIE